MTIDRVTATECAKFLADAARLDSDRAAMINELAVLVAEIIEEQLEAERLRIR